MRYKTFSPELVDATKEPMFFGKPVNIARYDVQKYNIFEKQIRKQMGFFWVPEEVALNQDAHDFHNALDDAGRHIFTANLKYQSLLDSVQGRAPNIALLPFTSLPELETLIETWSFSETIHSRSYTHIIRNIYTEPTKVLDGILEVPEIVERAHAVTKYYDEFIEYGNWFNMFGYGTHTVSTSGVDKTQTVSITERGLCERLYRMIVAINILEGIRFYVSFACSWAFAESMQVMEKSAKIIKLICRDENLHLAITQTMLKKFRDGSEGELMKEIAAEMEDEVIEMYKEAVEQEKEWADFLFKDGSIVGLNAEILKQYVEYITNVRLRKIGLKGIYNAPSNPLPWTAHWIGSKDTQVAPQEEQITSYVVGGVENDVSKDSFGGFKL